MRNKRNNRKSQAAEWGKSTSKDLNKWVLMHVNKNQVHLSKREGVRPGVPGWIGCILRHSTL